MARDLSVIEKRVFGEDAERGRDGRPVEQGVGSPKQPTHPHAVALLKGLRARNAPDAEIKAAEVLERKLRGGDDPTVVA